MRPAYVYRAYDKFGLLLYVGCSLDVDGRLRYHEEHSAWWPFHADLTRTAFPSHDEALAAERVAIQTEHPRWNVRERSADHPDGRIADTLNAPHLREERDLWVEWKRATADETKARIRRERAEERINAVLCALYVDRQERSA